MIDQLNEEYLKDFPLYSHIDFDMTVCSQMLPIGLSTTYPEEFIKRVAAAGTSHLMLLSSVDYTLKMYLKDHKYDLPQERLDRDVSSLIQELTTFVSGSLKSFGDRGEGYAGLIVADTNLLRFPVTVQAVTTLAQRGMLFEPISVMRMGVEQLAWIHAVHQMTDEEEIMAAKPLKCISDLKKVYPTVGKFYGHLSKFAHWDPDLHHNFVGRKDDYISSIMAQCCFKVRSLFYAVLLAEIYVAVFESIYINNISEPKFFYSKNKNKIKKERETIKLLNDICNKYNKDNYIKDILALFP